MRQSFAAFALVLVKPRTKHAYVLGHDGIDTGRRVVRLRILAERRGSAVGRAVVYEAFLIIEFRSESTEEKHFVFQDRAADGETRENIAGFGLDHLIILVVGIDE